MSWPNVLLTISNVLLFAVVIGAPIAFFKTRQPLSDLIFGLWAGGISNLLGFIALFFAVCVTFAKKISRALGSVISQPVLLRLLSAHIFHSCCIPAITWDFRGTICY